VTRDNGTFCSLPWININTTPQGSCKLCCNIVDSELIMRGTGSEPARDFTKHTAMGWGLDGIEAIWNGQHMSSVRSDMLNGHRRRECGDCYHAESMGMPSPRTEANERYEGWLPKRLDMDPPLPISLELRLSTRCNLSCATCWSGSSDVVAREQIEQLARSALPEGHPDRLDLPDWLGASFSRELSNLSSPESDARYAASGMAFDNFAKLAPNLRRLYITGGEPTMDSNVHEYLRMLLDHGNADCHVSFTTNCTMWNDKLMSLVSRFRNAEIQMSVDGHEDENDWIRHHSQWLDVMGNIDRYFAYPNARLVFFTVVSALNALSLDGLLTYLRHTTNRHQRMAVWTPIILRHPSHLRAGALPLDDRMSAADRLERVFTGPGYEEHPFYHRDGLGRVLAMLRTEPHDPVGFNRLAEFMRYTGDMRSSMLRSFAKRHKISVDQLADNGYIVPRGWRQVFPVLAGVTDKAMT
jgi:MoaA/NifB/PqqE/SkfB family radical SAM enzyme